LSPYFQVTANCTSEKKLKTHYAVAADVIRMSLIELF